MVESEEEKENSLQLSIPKADNDHSDNREMRTEKGPM